MSAVPDTGMRDRRQTRSRCSAAESRPPDGGRELGWFARGDPEVGAGQSWRRRVRRPSWAGAHEMGRPNGSWRTRDRSPRTLGPPGCGRRVDAHAPDLAWIVRQRTHSHGRRDHVHRDHSAAGLFDGGMSGRRSAPRTASLAGERALASSPTCRRCDCVVTRQRRRGRASGRMRLGGHALKDFGTRCPTIGLTMWTDRPHGTPRQRAEAPLATQPGDGRDAGAAAPVAQFGRGNSLKRGPVPVRVRSGAQTLAAHPEVTAR